MKTTKIILIIAFSIIFPLIILRFNIENSNAFSSILTLISIVLGFSVTALSIIATSSFSKKLFKTESSNNNSLTLLHELVNSFKYSSYIYLSTILMILIFHFLGSWDSKSINFLKICFSVKKVLNSYIWYSTMCSLWAFIKVFSTFSKFVIKNASKKS